MLVRIEGNVGAGKTTLATRFTEVMSQDMRVEHLKEPVDSWRDYHGTNLLNVYYSDKRRWGFLFQTVALTHMHDIEKKAVEMCNEATSRSEPITVVMERSTFSVSELFNELLYQHNYLTQPEHQALLGLSNAMQCPLAQYSQHVVNVYVRSPPDVCYTRLTERSRPEELGRVSLDYLRHLHDLHEKACNDEQLFPNALVIDNDGESTVDQMVESLVKRLQTISLERKSM